MTPGASASRSWNDRFVAFGGVIAYSVYRRDVLIRALAELGVRDIESGRPMERERLQQAHRSLSTARGTA